MKENGWAGLSTESIYELLAYCCSEASLINTVIDNLVIYLIIISKFKYLWIQTSLGEDIGFLYFHFMGLQEEADLIIAKKKSN